jgi:type VI protein secretion system component VasF
MNAMRGFRAAMTSLSTAWAAADHSRMRRALRIAATVLATTVVVALASFVAVALSLT